MNNNTVTSSNKNKNLLTAIKVAYRQYKSDIQYIKNVSGCWKQKSYTYILTELSVAWHNFYWRVLKRF